MSDDEIAAITERAVGRASAALTAMDMANVLFRFRDEGFITIDATTDLIAEMEALGFTNA